MKRLYLTSLGYDLAITRVTFARLSNALQRIDQFNEEEASFGYELSQYPKRKQIYDRLVPFKKLYDASNDFLAKLHSWLTSQVFYFILRICLYVGRYSV